MCIYVFFICICIYINILLVGSKVLVIVTMNYNTAQQITFDLSAFAAVKGPIVRWETSINGDVKYSQHTDVTLKGTSFSLHFNANTIQTFEVSGVM